MSISRCGLQISRDSTITNTIHDWPRAKQIGCLLGQISHDKESHLSEDTVEDQIGDVLAAGEPKGDIKMAGAGSNFGAQNLHGKGIFSAGKKFIGRLASIPRGAVERIAADVSNVFPDSDLNARPIYPGEHHQLLKLPNKKFGRANYSGPGTRIVKRLERGDPPRTEVDQVAQAHDIRYSLASGTDDVRKADNKMLRSLERLKREKLDKSFNILPAMAGISGKVAAENFGLLGREAFIDTSSRPVGGDRDMLKSKLGQLEQKGYGAISRNIRRFAKTDTFNPGPGTTKTQSLAFGNPLSTANMKGVPSVDRRQNRTVASQIGSRGVNTRGMFRDGTSGVTQSGDGQHPGAAAPASSTYINVKTAGQKGQGFGRIAPGASHHIVDVQTGAGAQRKTLTNAQMYGGNFESKSTVWPDRKTDHPGSQLLKKMRGQIKKGKNYDYHGIKGQGKKAVYWDNAGILANKMLPLVSVY